MAGRKLKCHNCSTENEIKEKIGREQLCRNCGAYLHCCFNCFFYAPTAYQQCRETEVEYVNNKKGANFCQYFKPGNQQGGTRNNRADAARQKLNDLFGAD